MGKLAMSTKLRTAADLNNLSSRELLAFLSNVSNAYKLLEERLTDIAVARANAINETRINDDTVNSGIYFYLMGTFLFVAGLFLFVSTGMMLAMICAIAGVFIVLVAFFQSKTGWGITGGKAQVSKKTARVNEASKLALLSVTGDQVLRDFTSDLKQNAGVTYDIIPEDYRMYYILNTFCKYLSDGRARNWSECINNFLIDIRQEETFRRIEENHAETMRELKKHENFAKANLWSTLSIASKIR